MSKQSPADAGLSASGGEMSAEAAAEFIASAPILTGATPQSIRADLYKAFGQPVIDRLERIGRLRILADAADLPRKVSISNRGKAIFQGDVAYLIANRMEPATARRELLHEIGEHYGLPRMLGEKGYAALLRRVRMMEKAGNVRIREAFADVRRLYPELAESSDEFMHEVLANVGQDAAIRARPWWQEIVAAVKRFLVRMGFTGRIDETDIQDMVLASLRAAAREEREAAPGMVPAFETRSAMKSIEANIRRGREALAKTVTERTSVHRAMFRNGMGWVDFVWGDEGRVKPSGKAEGAMGLAHIIEARMRKDGMSPQEADALLDRIVEVIARGSEIRRIEYRGSENVTVGLGDAEAVLVRNPGSNAWVLNGWKVNPDAARAGNVAPGATHAATTTPRGGMGAGFDEIIGETEEPGKPGMESRSAPPIWNSPDTSRADDVIYTLQDKHVDLKRVQQAIKDAIGGIRDDVDAYLQEELFHGRAAKATEEFLDRELKPFLGEMNQRGIDMETLETYLWARHASERNVQIAKINPGMPDGGSGLTDRQAQAILAGKDVQVQGQTVKSIPQEKLRSLADLSRKIDMMVAGNRMMLELYELETPETIAAWKGAYQYYVPLHREDAEAPWAGPGTGMGYSVRGASSKRATGSFRPVENILANLTLQRTRTITRGEKNRVAQALYGLANEAKNDEFWKTDDAPTIRTVKEMAIYRVVKDGAALGEFTRLQDAKNAARDGGDIHQDWGERVVEQVDPAFRSRPNVVWARFNGQDRFVIFNEHDPRAVRMAESLKNLDANDIGLLLGEAARWTRYIASINTQYNPVFGIMNLIRDTGTGIMNLGSTPLAGKQAELLGHVWQALPAIYKAQRIDRSGGAPTGAWAQLWEEFQEIGGQTGYRDMFRNAQEQQEALQRALDKTWWQRTYWGKALTAGGLLSVPEQFMLDKVGKPIFEWLSDYNTMMENGIRLAAYKVAIDHGMSKERAASLAKNLTVNFNRKGQVARQAGALYAFFNASVQGTARMAETMHHGAEPGNILGRRGKQIVAGGLLLGAMQAMWLMAAGFDDDEPPEFVRDRNIVIPIGGKKYLAVPLPLGFHVLPAVGKSLTEFVLGGFKRPGDRIAHVFDVLADAFNPIGNTGMSLQTIAPTVIDPLAALAENKDWTGKPIYREDLSKLSPTPGYLRTKDTATALSKAMAYWINIGTGGTDFRKGLLSPTPDQIDYLIGQVTGGVGRELGKVDQMVSSAITGEELPAYKIPLIGRLYGTAEGRAPEGNRFYANLKAMNEHQAEIEGLVKSGKREEAASYMKEHPESAMFREADRTQRLVSKLQKQKIDLRQKSGSQDTAKNIDEQITRNMRNFNQRVAAAEKRAGG